MSIRKLKCLIVEDEPIAAEILEDYIQQVPFLHLGGVCADAILAMDTLKKNDIDVLFLDIHLPKLKGLEFLKMLDQKPQTILTTAYHEYALDAFEEGVVDYLMKPIAFSRFLKAVNKLQYSVSLPTDTHINQDSRSFRFYNVNKKQVKVYFDEVLYVESLKDYTRIVTETEKLVTRRNLSDMEKIFKPQGFLRIHRSFLVSMDKIKAYGASGIDIDGKELPVGRSYKELVKKALEQYFQ